jgi:hypothetical protein
LQASVSYTWSHSIDIASTDAFANYLSTPSSVAKPNIDRGKSDLDIRHAFTAGVTYDLPSPESNKIAHTALGGWSVGSFIFARKAPPVDVVSGIVFADGIAVYPRPDVVPGVPLLLYGPQYPAGKAFNPAAFTPAPVLRPRLWRGRDRERDDAVAIAIRNQRRRIRKQIDMAVKIKSVRHDRHSGPTTARLVTLSTSSIPRLKTAANFATSAAV